MAPNERPELLRTAARSLLSDFPRVGLKARSLRFIVKAVSLSLSLSGLDSPLTRGERRLSLLLKSHTRGT